MQNNEEMKARIEALEAIVVKQNEENKRLREQLDAVQSTMSNEEFLLKSQAAKAAGEMPTFKVEGKLYCFTAPAFKLNGIKYTASEAVKDVRLLKEMIEKGYGVIKEVGEPESKKDYSAIPMISREQTFFSTPSHSSDSGIQITVVE
ncbi:MAG: hypothetical protein ACK4TA_00160 [Saprospiraceae bacterium]